MLEEIILDIIKLILGVVVGTYVAMKIVYRSLFKQIVSSLTDFLKSDDYRKIKEKIEQEYKTWKELVER